MAGTKLVCPQCKTVLKSSKSLPVGKSITCARCQQQFTIAPEMLAAGTGETHDGTGMALGETQAGTQKSPMAAARPLQPRSNFDYDEPESAPLVSRPRRRHSSGVGVWIAVAAVMLLLVIGGGAGLAFYLFGPNRIANARPDSDPKKSLAQAKPSPPPAVKLDTETKKTTVPTKSSTPANDPQVIPAIVKSEQPNKILPAVVALGDKKLTAKQQEKIVVSTAKGVQFLKSTILPSGTWKDDEKNAVGYAALPGLAMLECGVPLQDPVIQQAAAFVRAKAPKTTETYDIGMAILFLDSLDDPADKKLIQILALRLIAGQNRAGGWGYECPFMDKAEQNQLLEFLNTHKPEVKLLIPLRNFGIPESSSDTPRGREEGPGEPAAKGKTIEPKKKGSEPAKKSNPAKQQLSARLDKLPIVVNQKTKVGCQFEDGLTGDNSNTHLALMGLWAARRHETPVELSLGMAAERFQKSQAKDGGWGYVINQPPKNSMTCVGLLSLAMGHASAAEIFAEAAAKSKVPVKTLAKDSAISQGLSALSMYIDGEKDRKGLESRIDLYYLWTLERVGILYRQKEFGKRDWYDYGVKFILKEQQDDGHWKAHYDPPADTAFALLFMQRSDLVEDLTQRLHAYIDIPNTVRARAPDLEQLRSRGSETVRNRGKQ
jgi:hypothetical protein